MTAEPTTRVFVARHGEADYESGLVTDDGGWLNRTGRGQAHALGRQLSAERITRVWTSPLSRAVQTAEIVAGVIDADVVVREGLREYGVGSLAGTDGDEAGVIGPVFRAWMDGDDSAMIPGGENIAAIVERVSGALEEVAAAHCGGQVLVVSHGGAILATIPILIGQRRDWALHRDLPGGTLVDIERQQRRWRLRSWAGEPTGD